MATLPAIEVQDAVVDDFRGPWLRPQNTDVPSSEALLSQNGEYGPHFQGTRFGFGNFWTLAKTITTLYNWLRLNDSNSPQGNLIVLYNMTDNKVQIVKNLLSPALTDCFAVLAEGISVTEYGLRVYVAVFSTSGGGVPSPIGAAECRYITTNGGADKAFLGGSTGVPTLSLIGSGNLTTPGLHSVGYVITSPSGFQGPVNPITSFGNNLFNAASQIICTPGKAIQLSVNIAVPIPAAGTYRVDLVMSPVNNPYQFLIVPNNFATWSGGLFTFTTFTGIPDSLLISSGQDVTQNQYLLTQDGSGSGPFSPFKVIEYGARMVYLTYDGAGNPAAYVSNPGQPEQITELYHKLRLPGVRQITSGFVLRGILYLTGPNWTYGFQDTGGLPATWPQATLVDGDIGCSSCLGAVVSASNDWAAVVSKTGLYIFNGQFQERPLTYMLDNDWRRISWGTGAQRIRIANNKDKKQIYVMVCLDSSTYPNYIMVFDYTDGLDYQSVKYSLWSIANYDPYGMAIVRNPSTGRLELWLGSSSTTQGGPTQGIVRQMNDTDDGVPTCYSDWVSGTTQTIPHLWECAPQPEGAIGQIMAHVGGYVRAVGKGSLAGTTYSLDRVKSSVWTNLIQLAAVSGVEYFRQFYLTSERASVRFTCGTNPGDYVILSGYRHRYYPWALRR